jgi:hypothetical protein
MEHILQFGINIDDDAIVKAIMTKAEKMVIDDLISRTRKEIDETIYSSGYYRDRDLRGWVKDEFIKFLENNKDDIISRASEKLADKLSRTKQVKEAVSEVLKELDT